MVIMCVRCYPEGDASSERAMGIWSLGVSVVIIVIQNASNRSKHRMTPILIRANRTRLHGHFWGVQAEPAARVIGSVCTDPKRVFRLNARGFVAGARTKRLGSG
jgi:hypothetical protein